MADARRRNGILAITYALLVVTASWTAARFVAWQHEGWAGFYYAPAMQAGFKGKTVFLKPGTVASVFSGGPAEAAGLVEGDVILTVNGIPTSDWERLGKLDDQLGIHDEIAYQVRHKNGLRESARLQLSSPLRSRQIQVSTITSLAVAVAFCILGTIVYRRKPEDERALVFYLLSLAATTLFVVRPLAYVDEFPSRGARSLAQMTMHQVVLYVVLTILGYLVQVLFVHLALVFPQRRRILENNPQLLRWLYLTPLLIFVGFPTFALLSLPLRVLHGALFGFCLLVLMIVVYLAKCWTSEGWKRALRTRPVMVLGLVALLVITSMHSVLMLVSSQATRETIGWIFGGITFGFTYLIFFVIYSVIACVSLYRSYRESGIEERKQVRWPLWGTIVSLSGVLFVIGLMALLDWIGLQRFVSMVAVEVVTRAFYIFIPLSFAFAILKYRLMEIDVVIRKTVTYSIVSGCVAAVYFALAGGLGGLLVTRANVHSTWITVGATLATVAVFIPVRKRVQNVVDKRFFRSKEDLPHALRTLNAKTTEIADLPALLNVVAEHIVQVLRVRNAVIFRKLLREQTFMPAVEVGLHDRIEPTTLLKGLRFAGNTPLLASAGVAFRPSNRLPERPPEHRRAVQPDQATVARDQHQHHDRADIRQGRDEGRRDGDALALHPERQVHQRAEEPGAVQVGADHRRAGEVGAHEARIGQLAPRQLARHAHAAEREHPGDVVALVQRPGMAGGEEAAAARHAKGGGNSSQERDGGSEQRRAVPDAAPRICAVAPFHPLGPPSLLKSR